jgi:hypothetical protein
VPIDPDEKFEKYLKLFRPSPPDQLQLDRHRFAPVARQMATWGTVAAVIIIFVFLALYSRVLSSRRPDEAALREGEASHFESPQSLTIQSANELLARAPSFKAAVDAMGFPSPAVSLPDKRSAVGILSKEPRL